MSTNAKSLEQLVTDALIAVLGAHAALSGLTIADVNTVQNMSRPVAVVSAVTNGEAIYKSGVFSLTATVAYLTTNATDDDQFVEWEGALWNTLSDVAGLPAALVAQQTGLKVYAAREPNSTAPTFTDLQRDIEYNINLISAKEEVA